MKKTLILFAMLAFSFALTDAYASSLKPKLSESKPFVLASNPAYV